MHYKLHATDSTSCVGPTKKKANYKRPTQLATGTPLSCPWLIPEGASSTSHGKPFEENSGGVLNSHALTHTVARIGYVIQSKAVHGRPLDGSGITETFALFLYFLSHLACECHQQEVSSWTRCANGTDRILRISPNFLCWTSLSFCCLC
jgi:hypothetical protein